MWGRCAITGPAGGQQRRRKKRKEMKNLTLACKEKLIPGSKLNDCLGDNDATNTRDIIVCERVRRRQWSINFPAHGTGAHVYTNAAPAETAGRRINSDGRKIPFLLFAFEIVKLAHIY